MAIHYRCRCGQEVSLRPREGIYMVVGLLVGLTLLNTTLTALLWFRLPPDDPKNELAIAGAHSEDRGFDAGAELPRRDASDRSVKDVGSEGEPFGADPEPAAIPVRAPDGSHAAGPSFGSAPDSGGTELSEAADAPSPPREYRFPPPNGLDGLAMAALLNALPEDATDRVMVLLACVRWGAGFLGVEARKVLAGIDGTGDGDLGEVWPSGIDTPPGEPASVSDEGLPTRRVWLEEFEKRWDDRWSELLANDSSNVSDDPLSVEARTWLRASREGLSRPRDILVLVDLTESMAVEIEAAVAALRVLVPLTLAPENTFRWGWIGYRDEVVETQALTADGNRFLASLTRWIAESGGDVPEGVDRAIFEALRFGSFEWGADAQRILVVVGDSPPPFERIRGMLSLVEAAHGSPERYVVHSLGILRERDWDHVPAFRELARAGGGASVFLRGWEPPAPGRVLAGWWRLIAGPSAPPWEDRPF